MNIIMLEAEGTTSAASALTKYLKMLLAVDISTTILLGVLIALYIMLKKMNHKEKQKKRKRKKQGEQAAEKIAVSKIEETRVSFVEADETGYIDQQPDEESQQVEESTNAILIGYADVIPKDQVGWTCFEGADQEKASYVLYSNGAVCLCEKHFHVGSTKSHFNLYHIRDVYNFVDKDGKLIEHIPARYQLVQEIENATFVIEGDVYRLDRKGKIVISS